MLIPQLFPCSRGPCHTTGVPFHISVLCAIISHPIIIIIMNRTIIADSAQAKDVMLLLQKLFAILQHNLVIYHSLHFQGKGNGKRMVVALFMLPNTTGTLYFLIVARLHNIIRGWDNGKRTRANVCMASLICLLCTKATVNKSPRRCAFVDFPLCLLNFHDTAIHATSTARTLYQCKCIFNKKEQGSSSSSSSSW